MNMSPEPKPIKAKLRLLELARAPCVQLTRIPPTARLRQKHECLAGQLTNLPARPRKRYLLAPA